MWEINWHWDNILSDYFTFRLSLCSTFIRLSVTQYNLSSWSYCSTNT